MLKLLYKYHASIIMLVLVFVIEFVGKSGPPAVHVLSAIFLKL